MALAIMMLLWKSRSGIKSLHMVICLPCLDKNKYCQDADFYNICLGCFLESRISSSILLIKLHFVTLSRQAAGIQRMNIH